MKKEYINQSLHGGLIWILIQTRKLCDIKDRVGNVDTDQIVDDIQNDFIFKIIMVLWFCRKKRVFFIKGYKQKGLLTK